jgi:HEAT repeat protein
MSKKAFEEKIAAVDALRLASDPREVVTPLRKALSERNNYLVSKAAAITALHALDELIPELLSAFDRFLVDAVKSDPQCWAKNAIVKALKDLDHRQPDVYLRGISHIQLEPVWQGSSDTAATLRGACALALVNTPLDDLRILTELTSRLADAEKTVRMDTAVALAQLGKQEGALLLRLKSLIGDAEPEVTGQCLMALLAMGGDGSLEFVAGFLKSPDEYVRMEAIAALAQARSESAVEHLRQYWKQRLPPLERRGLVQSLAGSPIPSSAEFLIEILVEENGDLAEAALRSLAVGRFRNDFRDRIKAAVHQKPDLKLHQIVDSLFPV